MASLKAASNSAFLPSWIFKVATMPIMRSFSHAFAWPRSSEPARPRARLSWRKERLAPAVPAVGDPGVTADVTRLDQFGIGGRLYGAAGANRGGGEEQQHPGHQRDHHHGGGEEDRQQRADRGRGRPGERR